MDYYNLSKDELISKIEKLERDLIKAKSNNKKLKKLEDTVSQQSSILEFINSIAIPSAHKSSIEEFSKILLKAVKEYTGAVLASFSYYQSDKKELNVLHVEAEQNMLKTVLKIAGEKVVKTPMPVDDKTYKLIVQEIVGTFNNFTEVTFGAVPRFIDKAIRASTGIDRLYPIAHVVDGELYGTTMLAFKKGQASPSKELLESYAHLISVSLRRYNAEKALEDSETKYRTYIEHAPLGIFIANDKGKYIDVNPGAAELLGYTQAELLKLSIPDVLANENDIASFQKLKQEGKLSYEINLKKKDGTIVSVRLDAVLLPNNQFIAFHTDITEQKQAEKALKESEEKFRETANLMPQIIFESDLKGNLTYVNKNALIILGYPEDYPMLGKSALDLFTPESKIRGVENISQKVAGNKKNVSNEYEMVRKDGSTFPALVYSTPIVKEGNPVGMRGIIVDITELKKAELELIEAKEKAEENETKFKAAFYTSPDAVNINKMDGEFVEINEGFTRLSGYTEDDVIGKRSSEINIWSIPEGRDKLITALQEFGFIENLENQFKTKDGRLIPTLMSAKIISIKDEPHILSVTKTISDLKKFEQELITAKEKAEESEQRLKLATSSGELGVWDWNVKKNTMVWDERMFQLYGITEETFANTVDAWLNGLHPEDKERAIAESNKALAGDKQFNTEFRVLHPDGKVLYIKGDGLVLSDSNGKAERMIGVNRDITESKLNEIELVKAKEKAEESDRLKSAFLANMSHEIRTPMNGILGFTNLLKEPGLSGKEQKKYIDIIEKSGDRMLNTVNDIIDISRIEAGQVDVVISEISLNKQLNDLFEFFLPEATKKNIKLSVTKGVPDQHVNFKSDKEKLNSILTNFIKNAIKYTHEGSIEFGYSILKQDKKAELEFYVKDTGIGISKDRQKAVFNRFVQADIEDKQAYEGSGLGLAISKAYVEMLGGKIWVESEEGVGSQFYFTIPYTENTQETPGKNAKDSNESLTVKNGLKVLIADDDEIASTYLSIVLNEYQKDILIAKTGTEAVEMCRNNSDIDIVLMDIKIPGIDGYEATRQIREFNKEVFILAQTAYAQSGDREKSINAGCDDYISKPINKEKLLELISKRF